MPRISISPPWRWSTPNAPSHAPWSTSWPIELDLQVAPRDDSDRPLTEKLTQLRAERDRIHRRWLASDRAGGPRNDLRLTGVSRSSATCSIWSGRSPSYGTNSWCATPTTPATPPCIGCERSRFKPYLPADTLLLEWFIADGRPVAVPGDAGMRSKTRRLEVETGEHPADALTAAGSTWAAYRRSAPSASPGAGGQCAAAPAASCTRRSSQPISDDASRAIPGWIIVPHGPLHYLPFHALHDGRRVTSLSGTRSAICPAASLLRYCRPAATGGYRSCWRSATRARPAALRRRRGPAGWPRHLAARYMWTSEPPWRGCAPRPADAASSTWPPTATSAPTTRSSPAWRWPTAGSPRWIASTCASAPSLVTLSGCQTGRSVVGGGDELLGLTRALLSAGAASLVLSLWAVEDASTARLMEAFYAHLAAGCTKGEALRQAQTRVHPRARSRPDAAQAAAMLIRTPGRRLLWWEMPARCSDAFPPNHRTPTHRFVSASEEGGRDHVQVTCGSSHPGGLRYLYRVLCSAISTLATTSSAGATAVPATALPADCAKYAKPASGGGQRVTVVSPDSDKIQAFSDAGLPPPSNPDIRDSFFHEPK